MESDLRKQQTDFAAKFNLTLEEYLLVVRSCLSQEVVTVLELMKARSPKSGYRAQCQKKVRRWLALNHNVGKPLSDQDFKFLVPRYPITWNLPK